ncbi:MAG TPA: adenine deaminase C-terminal domain-containing protein [Bryobacteraceae bacterium]|nr:adenine deaminase C-terminal domain-containing protein [Bryobacteraceae bacterium]
MLAAQLRPSAGSARHDHNTTTQLLVIGRDLPAAETIANLGGGIATAGGWQFPLIIAGMMSSGPFAAVRAQADRERRMRAAGFPFGYILYALLFLTCDLLPGWRLTPRGVLDVKTGEIVASPVSAL